MNGINYLIARAGGYQPPDFDYTKAKGNSLAFQKAEQEVADFPRQVAAAEERQGMERQKFQWLSEDRVRQLQTAPIKDSAEQMKYLLSVGPLITFQNYGQSRDWLTIKNGFPSFLLPEPEAFVQKAKENGEPVEGLFEKWKDLLLTTTEDKLKEKLSTAKLESAEKIASTRMEGMERVADARLQGMERVADIRAQHQKEMADIRAAQADERGLAAKQRESRLSIFRLYGMNEFSSFDETTSDKAAEAISEASEMLKEYPDLDPQTAAARAKRRVDARYKAIKGIPQKEAPGHFIGKGNRPDTLSAVKKSLDGGVDTRDIFHKLVEKGWSEQEAIKVIREAAGIKE